MNFHRQCKEDNVGLSSWNASFFYRESLISKRELDQYKKKDFPKNQNNTFSFITLVKNFEANREMENNHH